MKTLQISDLETILAGDGNCTGIYRACTAVAALGGMAIVAASAGWGIVFGVAASGAGMELCRQQYIGCH